MKRLKIIGFDRRLELDWLDVTADCISQKLSPQITTNRLTNYLSKRIPSIPAQRKTLTVLQGIWIKVPDYLVEFRNSGANLLRNQDKSTRLPVHWGMCIASYPFFGFVVQQIGRLNRLQGEINTAQVRRRVIEKYGDTERVRRSVRHVVQSLNTWKVIIMIKPGIYQVAASNSLSESSIQSWLVESLLYRQRKTAIIFSEVRDENRLFPFKMEISQSELVKNPRLNLTRQNIDSELITLRNDP